MSTDVRDNLEAADDRQVAEWNHYTVADGEWLNDNDILPLKARDEYLADELDKTNTRIAGLVGNGTGFIVENDAEKQGPVISGSVSPEFDSEGAVTNLIKVQYTTPSGTVSSYAFASLPSENGVHGFDKNGYYRPMSIQTDGTTLTGAGTDSAPVGLGPDGSYLARSKKNGSTWANDRVYAIGNNVNAESGAFLFGQSITGGYTKESQPHVIIGHDVTAHDAMGFMSKCNVSGGAHFGINITSLNGDSFDVGTNISACCGIHFGNCITARNSVTFGNCVTASGGIQFGSSIQGRSSHGVLIGNCITADGTSNGAGGGIAIGQNVYISGAIGIGCDITANQGLALGSHTRSDYGIALGEYAYTNSGYAFGGHVTASNQADAFGVYASANSASDAFGTFVTAGSGSIAFGRNISATSAGICFGHTLSSSSGASLNVGRMNNISGAKSIAIGDYIGAKAGGIGIGNNITAYYNNMLIGRNLQALDAGLTTYIGQNLKIGSYDYAGNPGSLANINNGTDNRYTTLASVANGRYTMQTGLKGNNYQWSFISADTYLARMKKEITGTDGQVVKDSNGTIQYEMKSVDLAGEVNGLYDMLKRANIPISPVVQNKKYYLMAQNTETWWEEKGEAYTTYNRTSTCNPSTLGGYSVNTQTLQNNYYSLLNCLLTFFAAKTSTNCDWSKWTCAKSLYDGLKSLKSGWSSYDQYNLN